MSTSSAVAGAPAPALAWTMASAGTAAMAWAVATTPAQARAVARTMSASDGEVGHPEASPAHLSAGSDADPLASPFDRPTKNLGPDHLGIDVEGAGSDNRCRGRAV